MAQPKGQINTCLEVAAETDTWSWLVNLEITSVCVPMEIHIIGLCVANSIVFNRPTVNENVRLLNLARSAALTGLLQSSCEDAFDWSMKSNDWLIWFTSIFFSMTLHTTTNNTHQADWDLYIFPVKSVLGEYRCPPTTSTRSMPASLPQPLSSVFERVVKLVIW